jgi:hypothetical protein
VVVPMYEPFPVPTFMVFCDASFTLVQHAWEHTVHSLNAKTRR